ncbi:hypothetical protein GUJ93_ZPchr0034g18728 [Zizania palustris]|uniref:Uncharacterized protein n=1 Tax=Zizania palustris TaxID=103762 RepID=A0A8J5VAT9_ZIZPA|nr:hypothetical protein GUJ93_ZPchr0034g18728 [Zizania palustris]
MTVSKSWRLDCQTEEFRWYQAGKTAKLKKKLNSDSESLWMRSHGKINADVTTGSCMFFLDVWTRWSTEAQRDCCLSSKPFHDLILSLKRSGFSKLRSSEQ